MATPTSSASKRTARDVTATAVFTIEILIVVTILGVMAAIAAFSMHGILEHAARVARSTQHPSQPVCLHSPSVGSGQCSSGPVVGAPRSR